MSEEKERRYPKFNPQKAKEILKPLSHVFYFVRKSRLSVQKAYHESGMDNYPDERHNDSPSLGEIFSLKTKIAGVYLSGYIHGKGQQQCLSVDTIYIPRDKFDIFTAHMKQFKFRNPDTINTKYLLINGKHIEYVIMWWD